MPHHPANDLRNAQRRQEIAARYLRGELQVLIAAEMGVNQGTISRDLKAIQAFWMENAVEDLMAKKARELAKIDANELRYLEGWERSLKPRVIVQRDIELIAEEGDDQDDPKGILASLVAANDDESAVIEVRPKRGRPQTKTAPLPPGASRQKISIRREEQVGDPRFLNGMDRCVEMRIALFGLNAATKFKIDLDNCTDEQLERLAAGEPAQQVMAQA